MPAPDESSSRRRLQVDGVDVHYHDLGAGEPLLLLPAYGPIPGTTAWLTYHRVLPVLAERFRCILPDYPNFGRSGPVVFDEPVHDLYVRQALALMDHLGVQSANVVGASTGGTVALDLALTAPGRVRRLIVGGCEASTGGDPYLLSPQPSEVARLSAECQLDPPDRDRIRRLLKALVYDPGLITEELVSAMYDWRVAEPQHAESWARSRSRPASKLDRLATLQAPILVIHGRLDRMTPLETALRLISYLPAADLIVLNRCGHWAPFERPADYSRAVLAFLSE